jgi:glycosyltransferase involved in cell wall biosynthesis
MRGASAKSLATDTGTSIAAPIGLAALMRIAFINQPRDYLFTSGIQKGSVSTVTWELARRLAASHDVVIYAPRAPNQVLEERSQGVVVRRIPHALRRIHRALELASGMAGTRVPYFARTAYFREYILAVAGWIERDLPDCVHVQVASQFLPVIRRAAPNAFITLHAHDELLTRVDPVRVESRLAHADVIVTCSEYITRQWRKYFPSYARRIRTLDNGVDLARFQPGPPLADEARSGGLPRSREILYVGRVSPEKGVHVLAAAFNQVLRSFPDARLSIVGPAGLLPIGCILTLADDIQVASLREFYGSGVLGQVIRQVLLSKSGYVDAIVSRLSKEARERVRIVGAVDYDRLPDLYRGAGILAAPSIMQEPFGLPVVEALASGLPVIATRAGEMSDLVTDGVTGRLVERGDADGLAAAICDVFADPGLLARMSVAARAAAIACHGWDQTVERLEAIFGGASELPYEAQGATSLPR